jgi:glycosyltransferase involved in cell wall biosynthesis
MKISVLMATHNGAKHVEEQLMSILSGSRLPDEMVIVDDGSTDRTPALVQAMVHAWPDLQWVFSNNGSNLGASLTFANAVKLSTGDLLFFADQDDVWAANKAECFETLFSNKPELLMAYSDGSIVDQDLRPTGQTIFSTRKHADLQAGGSRQALDIAANPDIKGCTMALNGAFARTLFAGTDKRAFACWGHDHWAALFAYGLGEVAVIGQELILHRFHAKNTSAATRFNPANPEHWSKYIRAAKQQGIHYFVDRYTMALERVEQYTPEFSGNLTDALARMLAISKDRRDMRSLALPGRLRKAWGMYRAGVYRKHYNGLFTLLRDIWL